jgi:hypothetical protein
MRTYIDLYFSPDAVSPTDIGERIQKLAGLSYIRGPHDLIFEWTTMTEFHEILGKIHGALAGTGVLYRVETVAEEPAFVEPIPWAPPLSTGPGTHPLY